MNTFIFEGFYDNILKAFGWQNINIRLPLKVGLNLQVKMSKYILELKE
nr:DUF4865 family protein [Lactococcus lactis]